MDYEIKQLSLEESLNYKYQIIKMLIDLDNSMIKFVPPYSDKRKMTEKEFLDGDTFDDVINETYDKKGIFIVAMVESNIIGLIDLRLRDAKKDRYEGIIYNFYVKDNSRSNGIGTELMNAGFNYFKGLGNIDGVSVGMMSKNIKVIKFYERFGFKERYYESRYVML